MNTIKMLPFLVVASIIMLIYLSTTLSNPIMRQYDKLVEKLMANEQLNNEDEVLDSHPELIAIKNQIQHIIKMHHDTQEASRHPAIPGSGTK